MTAQLEDAILDGGLTLIDTGATRIVICQAEPTSFGLATWNQTNCLGWKSWAAGGAFGSPAAGSPGRKVTSTVVSDGTIATSGTAAWWAVVTEAALYAHGSLSASQVVTAGNTFSLAAFDIKMLNS